MVKSGMHKEFCIGVQHKGSALRDEVLIGNEIESYEALINHNENNAHNAPPIAPDSIC